MKILIVTQYYYPENFRINDLVNSLCLEGHEVCVLTGIPNYPSGKFFGTWKLGRVEGKPEIFRVPILPRGSSKGFSLAINYLSFLITAVLSFPWFFGRRFDATLSINYSPNSVSIAGLFLSKVVRARHFVWLQDLWPESLIATGVIREGAVSRGIRAVLSFVYKRSSTVFVQSMSFSSNLESMGVKKEAIVFLPNWAEDIFESSSVTNPSNAARTARLHKAKGSFVITFAGNIGAAQGLDILLEAARSLKERKVVFLIVGDGRAKRRLQASVSNAGVDEVIQFLGSFPVEEMPALFESSDAMLVSLVADKEINRTIPGKVQSYLRAGTLVIGALDGEGNRVLGEAGQVVGGASDGEALYQNIVSVLTMTNSEREAIRQKGREYYRKHFDRRLVVSRLVNSIAGSKFI